jgi:hypothetical protein
VVVNLKDERAQQRRPCLGLRGGAVAREASGDGCAFARLVELVGRDADAAVFNGERQPQGIVLMSRKGDFQRYFTPLGKFDRVTTRLINIWRSLTESPNSCSGTSSAAE